MQERAVVYSEYRSEGDFGWSSQGEYCKVSQEARGDWIATASRRGTCCTDRDILHIKMQGKR